MKLLIIILLGIYFILFLFFSRPKRSFIRFFFRSAAVGVLALFILHFFSGSADLNVPLNIYTIGLSALFGAPGVIAVLLFPLIFI